MNNYDDDSFYLYKYSIISKNLNYIEEEDYKIDFILLFSSIISDRMGASINFKNISPDGTCEFSIFTDKIESAIKLNEFVTYLRKENKLEELISSFIADGSRLGLKNETKKLYDDYELYKNIEENYFSLNRELFFKNDNQIHSKKIKL